VEVQLHAFLTTVLDDTKLYGEELQVSNDYEGERVRETVYAMEKTKISFPYWDSNYNFSGRAAYSLVTVLTIGINNCTANCTLQRLYQGVLYFKNITRFYGTSL
jgi:hypothetical protein